MAFEKRFFLPEPFWLVASDEAGRGPLAGPVVGAAVGMRIDDHEVALKQLRKLKRQGVTDSKVLSGARRREILQSVGWDLRTGERTRVSFGTFWGSWSQCSPQEIDEVNILQASMKCMSTAAELVAVEENSKVVWLVDGNYCPRESKVELIHPVVGGDAKSVLIGLASLIAKETRDQLMRQIHESHPQYGFDQHAGYGTKRHREAIGRYGLTPWHRRTFQGVREHAGAAAGA
jgi:ribonuclease HII